MRRFFVTDITETAETAAITGTELAHLKKVLRLGAGDPVALFDGKGLELAGTITEIGNDRAVVQVVRSSMEKNESPIDIVLIAGLTRAAKPELVVQKATELGAATITFYPALRTVPIVEEKKRADKLKRWTRVAREAAKQCGRTVVPEILLSPDLETAITGYDEMTRLVFTEEGGRGVRDALATHEGTRGVVVLVGPEGGMSEEEVERAVESGFVAVGMGPRTLRAETAAISAITIVQYQLGDMEPKAGDDE